MPKRADYQICAVCGHWQSDMGDDVVCDGCGECLWLPADKDGKIIVEEGRDAS